MFNTRDNYYYIITISGAKIFTWQCHVDDSTSGRNDIIIGRDLITKLVINIKNSKNTIECAKDLTRDVELPRKI